jgi:hypothetical protein
LTLAGCGAAEDAGVREFEQALEAELGDDADVAIDPDEDSISLDDDRGSFTSGVDLDIPDWIDPALAHPDDLSIDTLIAIDGITSARGTTSLGVEELAAFYLAAVTELSWTVDSSILTPPDFFQLLTTDDAGHQFDIEFVQGKLGFVIGRNRPET